VQYRFWGRRGSRVGPGYRAGPRTESICGIDYVIQRKISWIRDKNIALVASLAELKKQAPATGRSLESLAINDKAQVIVIGTVYSGTYIEICHVSFIVTRALSGQKLRLD